VISRATLLLSNCSVRIRCQGSQRTVSRVKRKRVGSWPDILSELEYRSITVLLRYQEGCYHSRIDRVVGPLAYRCCMIAAVSVCPSMPTVLSLVDSLGVVRILIHPAYNSSRSSNAQLQLSDDRRERCFLKCSSCNLIHLTAVSSKEKRILSHPSMVLLAHTVRSKWAVV
jgi:hypothetical protein